MYITPLKILLAYIVFFVIAAAVVFTVNGSFESEEVSNESSETYMNEPVEATYNETEEAVLTAAGDKSTCQICIEIYNAGDSIVQLPCRHIFCKNCIFTWLKAKVTCPSCRDDVRRHFT